MQIGNIISEGALVLLYLDKRRTWLFKARRGAKIHTHVGAIEHSDLIGNEYGSSVNSSLGTTLFALRPSIEEIVMKSERRTQIVYGKDFGLIATKCSVAPGSVIVEAGTGSGALTMYLANLVRPTGRVHSFELRPEFIQVARRNLERAGLIEYVELREADAREGFGVTQADIAIIDVGDPWALVLPAYNALRGGGSFVAVSPTMNQVEKVSTELKDHGFMAVETFELLMRSLEARPGMTRPSMRMVGHTAYLTFARKILTSEKG